MAKRGGCVSSPTVHSGSKHNNLHSYLSDVASNALNDVEKMGTIDQEDLISRIQNNALNLDYVKNNVPKLEDLILKKLKDAIKEAIKDTLKEALKSDEDKKKPPKREKLTGVLEEKLTDHLLDLGIDSLIG